jgi:4-hydroxythreonine-4-phosphate dehydrogenase
MKAARCVLTQGDPAGIGPEILAKVLLAPQPVAGYRPLLVAEAAALDALRPVLPALAWSRLVRVPLDAEAAALDAVDGVAWMDPLGRDRVVEPGRSGRQDAEGALAALDLGISLVADGRGDALVTAPIGKKEIADHVLPGFRGHTDYLAEQAGLHVYGRDYLMAFLSPGLRVALLTVHLPLRQAIDAIAQGAVVDALRCLDRHARDRQGKRPRIALPGLNPHAGESGLLGHEEMDILAPAVAQARAEGIDVHGPYSADSLFARARGGGFDWVLALYHDQGLIAVKTAAFGEATNWTLGLPYLRTSVDHGTALDIAGRGIASTDSLEAVLATTLELLRDRLA